MIEGITRLKNNKALGNSWMSAELFKQLAEPLAPALTVMFNYIRHFGTPPIWNRALLLSLYKKGNPKLADNYRGLSIMGALPKLYATIMSTRLDSELDASGLRAPTQAGFRQGARLEDNILLLVTAL